MDRFEVKFRTEHAGEASPNRDAVRTALAGAMGVQKERIVVHSMASEYGTAPAAGRPTYTASPRQRSMRRTISWSATAWPRRSQEPRPYQEVEVI